MKWTAIVLSLLFVPAGLLSAPAEPIVIPPPDGPVMAHLGDATKPMPVIGHKPVTNSFTLPRGVFRITARMRFNGKTEGFRDYLAMPVFLEVEAGGAPLKGGSVNAPVSKLIHDGALAAKVENDGAPVAVTLRCVERIESPYGTPQAEATAFARRMHNVKARMKWTAEGKEFPGAGDMRGLDDAPRELDDLDLADEPAAAAPGSAAAAAIPMLLVESITVELVETLPEKAEADPYVITVEAPKTMPDGPGRFAATVTVTRTAGPARVSLHASLTDRGGRVFWQEEVPLRLEGEQAATALQVAHPELPPGQYLLNCVLKDAQGKLVAELPDVVDALQEHFAPGSLAKQRKVLPTAAVRVPVARMQCYREMGRELLWGFWGDFYNTAKEARTLAELGINVGFSADYRFPYRWYYDQAGWDALGGWPEDIRDHYIAKSYYSYSHQWIRHDPGAVAVDLWDELSMSPYVDPAKLREDMLRIWRVPRAWPAPVPTLAVYNRRSGNDCLSWDEVGREGFPGHGPAQNDLTWAGKAFEYDNICMRIEALRHLNPDLNASSGQGAGHDQFFFDSMHDRVGPWDGTLRCYASFLQALPRYGVQPWTWLVQLTPSRPEHVGHMVWAALAAGGRFMPIYSVGDWLGRFMTQKQGPQAGEATGEGRLLAENIARVQPLSPVLMSVRNRLNPEVLFWDPVYYRPDDGVLEGLLANGVQPEVGTDPAGRKLIIVHGSSLGGQDYASVRRAVEAGASLFMTAELDNGANAAKIFGLTVTDLPDLVLAEGDTSLPAEFKTAVQRRVDGVEGDLDLSPLAAFVPGFKGLTVKAKPGPAGQLEPGSPLRRVLSASRMTLGYVGTVGKGRVVMLNAHLPRPGQPPHQARNRTAHGALMGVVLEWAGVRGAFRCTEPGSDRISSALLGFELATKDGSQSYALLVPEHQAGIAFRPSDPEVRAVRDLCAGMILPWQEDAAGRYVDVRLDTGKGTLLALLGPGSERASSDALKMTPSVPGAAIPATEVAGGQTLHVAVGAAPGAHTYRLTVLGPDGRTIPGLTDWATGAGTVVMKVPVAVNDPDGKWTIMVDNLTDGGTGTAAIVKRGEAESRRGTAHATGAAADENGDENGGRSRFPRDPLSSPFASTDSIRQATDGETGRTLGSVLPAAIAAVPGAQHEAFALELDPSPRLEGDIVIGTIRGRLKSREPGERDAVVSVAIPAEYLLDEGSDGSLTVRLKGGQPADFAFTFCMHRDQLLALNAGFDYARKGTQTALTRRVRDEGIAVTAQVGEGIVARAKWTPDMLRWLRKPAGRIGNLSAGEYGVLVENPSGRDRRIELVCEGRTGWAEGRLNVSHQVAAGARVQIRQRVTWADSAKSDPGYHWLPLAVKVDGRAFAGHTLFVEECFEQPWWIMYQGLRVGADTVAGDGIAVEFLAGMAGPPARLPDDPKQAPGAGWRRLDTEGVLWGAAVAEALFGRSVPGVGAILAAAHVTAPCAREVTVGFLGSKPPSRIWVNDTLVEGAWSGMKDGGVGAGPVAFRRGVNVVIVEIELPLKPGDGTALVLRDPATGKRDRELIAGLGEGAK